jgi:histidine ammonia-lyase
MAEHNISTSLSFEDIQEIIAQDKKIELSHTVRDKIERCHQYLQSKVADPGNIMYGVNTGFGSLCNTVIPPSDLSQLQRNLLVSHACGTGPEVPREIVKIMLLLKIQSLSLGYSGVQIKTVETLVQMFNENIIPILYQQGSLGASGDLAPLAHLALPLIGEGEVLVDGQKIHSSASNISPIELKAKEGLALINGTQFMSAYGVYNIIKARKLWYNANLISALSLQAFDCRIEPYLEPSHRIRPHRGQLEVSDVILGYIQGSEHMTKPKKHVQDPYSFRCIPQVHGASFDVLRQVEKIFLTEINSVTDNPNVFPDEDLILSAGNFHGQPLALHLDFLSMAMAEMGNISERRTYKLISGERGLPAFLVAHPGINSGFMIPQYTAASIVSKNKQLCSPSSIDSITSSNGQEDHVSMGANSAVRNYELLENVETVLAIEMMNAVQTLEFRDEKCNPLLENITKKYRTFVPFLEDDTYMHPLIQSSIEFLKNNMY